MKLTGFMIVVMFGLCASAKLVGSDIPYVEASIPPFGIPKPEPEPETKCENYIATDFARRVETWLNTMENALQNSPDIETSMWECIVDMENIIATDNFVLTVCTADPNAKFITIARKALDIHLDLCGARAQR